MSDDDGAVIMIIIFIALVVFVSIGAWLGW